MITSERAKELMEEFEKATDPIIEKMRDEGVGVIMEVVFPTGSVFEVNYSKMDQSLIALLFILNSLRNKLQLPFDNFTNLLRDLDNGIENLCDSGGNLDLMEMADVYLSDGEKFSPEMVKLLTKHNPILAAALSLKELLGEYPNRGEN